MIRWAKKLEKEIFVEENLKFKTMVIKKSLPEYFKGVEGEESARIKHEMAIIKILKDEKPTFLPKYYIARSKSKKIANCLFMDYLNNPTLT